MGVFEEEKQVVHTLDRLNQSGFRLHQVYSPYPSHPILNHLNLKQSRVGYFTLIGGILGFLIGFGLSIYTASQWRLIVSGKPVIALIPFFIVGFECTILFGVFGNIIGMLTQARLPRFRMPEYYDSRFTGHHYGILASCDDEDMEGLVTFFQNNGGEAKPC